MGMTAYYNIYILLTDTGTLLSRMISLYTGDSMNHASISLDGSLKQVYSFGRKSQDNPFIGGFVREDLKGRIFQQADCVVLRLSVNSEQYEKLQTIIQRFEDNAHRYTYNLLGLAFVMFNLPLHRQHAYFCSEFVASTLSDAGIAVTDKPAPLVKPYDFARCSSLQLMYKGRLHDYLEHHDSNCTA